MQISGGDAQAHLPNVSAADHQAENCRDFRLSLRVQTKLLKPLMICNGRYGKDHANRPRSHTLCLQICIISGPSVTTRQRRIEFSDGFPTTKTLPRSLTILAIPTNKVCKPMPRFVLCTCLRGRNRMIPLSHANPSKLGRETMRSTPSPWRSPATAPVAELEQQREVERRPDGQVDLRLLHLPPTAPRIDRRTNVRTSRALGGWKVLLAFRPFAWPRARR